ncbi:MAG: DMT family transporter [Acidobacteria bacterium]|nr:DMT family transporter [Acidobacteriota bacterium]
MPSLYIYVLLALIAGAMMPTQAAVNNKMAGAVGSPFAAALISFVIGTLCLTIYAIFSGISVTDLSTAKNAPSIAWLGGLLGAFFVTTSIVLLPRLGVAMTFSLIVAGQMLATLFFDHFGLLGVPQKTVGLARVAGALLIIAGVVLIRKF